MIREPTRIIKIFIITILALSALVGCTQQQSKVGEFESYLKSNFDCVSIQSTSLDAPPILGGNQTSFYCSFKDKANNKEFYL